MRIANPIYDVVFKYLMLEDLNIAKLVISSLIGKKVLELTPYPTELTANNEPVKNTKRDSFTVYRLDFAAKIKESDGAERLILIELQKAKFISDIMRFRRYLGKQYMKKEHYYLVNSNKVPLPIYPIYILGHKLDDFTEEAIYIKRSLYNAITNEKLKTQKNIFIDGLTHDGLIIQIPYVNKTLETKGKTKFNKRLKELITIFDQSFQEPDSSEHFFDIDENSIPKWLTPVIRTLQKAAADPEVRQKMDLEDDYISELEEQERQTEEALKQAEESQKIAEEERRQKKEALKRAEETKKTLNNAIKLLMEMGLSEKEAKEKLDI